MRHTLNDRGGSGHGYPVGGRKAERTDMAGEGGGDGGATFKPFDEGWEWISLNDVPDMGTSDAPDMREEDFPPMRDEDFPPMRDEDFPPMGDDGFEPMREDDLIWTDEEWPPMDDEA